MAKVSRQPAPMTSAVPAPSFCSIPRPDSHRLAAMNIPEYRKASYLKRFKFGGTIMNKAYLCIP